MRCLKLLFVFAVIGLSGLLAACGGTSPDAAANALAPFTTDLEKLIADTKTTLMPLAQLPVAQGNDAAACTTVMADKLKSYAQYTTFGAAHLDGTLFCTSQPITAPTKILDRAYFQRALQTKDVSVGDYQIGKVTGKKSVGVGYPILDGSNTPQGIVLSPVDLDWLNQHLSTLSLPADAEMVMLDSEGSILAHAPLRPDLIGKPAADSPLGKAMLTQVDGSGEFAGFDGVTRVYKFTAPKGSNKNWFVAVGLKK